MLGFGIKSHHTRVESLWLKSHHANVKLLCIQLWPNSQSAKAELADVRHWHKNTPHVG